MCSEHYHECLCAFSYDFQILKPFYPFKKTSKRAGKVCGDFQDLKPPGLSGDSIDPTSTQSARYHENEVSVNNFDFLTVRLIMCSL